MMRASALYCLYMRGLYSERGASISSSPFLTASPKCLVQNILITFNYSSGAIVATLLGQPSRG
jgi:hypothetical protein